MRSIFSLFRTAQSSIAKTSSLSDNRFVIHLFQLLMARDAAGMGEVFHAERRQLGKGIAYSSILLVFEDDSQLLKLVADLVGSRIVLAGPGVTADIDQ